jgi:hypothetical protein
MQHPAADVIHGSGQHAEVDVAVGADGRRRGAVVGEERVPARVLRVAEPHARDRHEWRAVEDDEIAGAGAVADGDVEALAVEASAGVEPNGTCRIVASPAAAAALIQVPFPDRLRRAIPLCNPSGAAPKVVKPK